MCLHTFTVVKTSPTRSSSLQRRLRRNLTILARTYNLTPQGSPKRTKLKHHCSEERLNSGLDPYLINATPTNDRKVMLYSKNGFFLRIANNGDVAGTNDGKRATGKLNSTLFFYPRSCWRSFATFVLNELASLTLTYCSSIFVLINAM